MADNEDRSTFSRTDNVASGADYEKDDQRNFREARVESKGQNLSNGAPQVRELMNRFWKRVANEDLGFLPPARDNLFNDANPSRPTPPSHTLNDATQLALEHLFFQFIDRHRLLDDDRDRKFGRFRRNSATPATGPSAPASGSADNQWQAPPSSQAGQSAQNQTPSDPAVFYSDEELGIPRSPSTFSFDDGVAVLARALRNNAEDTSRTAAIMVRHFAPLYSEERLRDGATTREKLADAATMLMAPLARSEPLNSAVIECIPAFRQMMDGGLISENQRGEFTIPSVGEIQSLTALATVSSIAIENMSLRAIYEPWTVVYYHEILRMIAEMPEERIEAEKQNLERVLESSANNLAAGIGRMLQQGSELRGNPETWEKLNEDLVQVSILLADTRSTGSEEDIDSVARHLGITTTDADGKPFVPRIWANRLSGLHMVSMPSLRKGHAILNALRYVVVGLLRESIGAKDNTASAFFNAGVELIRIESTEPRLIMLRVIVNGIGLIGALRSTRNFAEAMRANDGSDCLVNLFGSLVNLTSHPEVPFPNAETGKLISIYGAISNIAPAIGPQDENRLTNSVQKLRDSGVVVPTGAADPTELSEAARSIVNAVGRTLGIKLEIEEGVNIAETAPFVLEAFAATLPAFQDDLPQPSGTASFAPKPLIAEFLTEFIRNMMAGPDNAYAVLREAYNRPLEDQPDLTISKIGPLRALGLKTEDEWDSICQEALGMPLSQYPAEHIARIFSKDLGTDH